jgi:Zn-dependent protease with chaperone function
VERAIDLLVEAALHGVVAALAAELLIRRLPVTHLPTRESARTAVLVLPLLSVPITHWLRPRVAGEAFPDWALFLSERWNAFSLAGWPLRDTLFAGFAALGAALLVRDGWRELHHALSGHRRRPVVPEEDWVLQARRALDELSTAAGTPAVALFPCASHVPVLAARGLWSPHIVVSASLVDRLRPEGVRAALAHELSHIVHRDVWRNLLLELLRALQWFNPVAQVVARRIALEREWRADDDAVRWTGQGAALARALVESVRARGGDFLGLLGRARVAALEVRCRRVLDRPLPQVPLTRLEWALASVSVALLAFFIR